MGYDFFGEGKELYHASSYFFRVEFQARGAPHIHSLLWLKDSKNEEAPNIWNQQKVEERETKEGIDQNMIDEARIEKVQKFADLLTTTSPENITCRKHETSKKDTNCHECKETRQKGRIYCQ